MDGYGLNATGEIGGNFYARLLYNANDATLKIFPIKQPSSHKPNSQLASGHQICYSRQYLLTYGDGMGVTASGGGTVNCHYRFDDDALNGNTSA